MVPQSADSNYVKRAEISQHWREYVVGKLCAMKESWIADLSDFLKLYL